MVYAVLIIIQVCECHTLSFGKFLIAVAVETAGNPLTEQDHSADSSSDNFMGVALENKRHSSHTGNTIVKSKHI
jgi:hypothetical protein